MKRFLLAILLLPFWIIVAVAFLMMSPFILLFYVLYLFGKAMDAADFVITGEWPARGRKP